MGWNSCVSHRKTRKLRRIRRKQGREGTSHWLSSSRITWTRTVLPVRRATEDKNERARTRTGDGWVEAGRSWSSRNIGAENYSGCGWCHLPDVRIYLCNHFQKWIGHGQCRLNVSSFACSQSPASIGCSREPTWRDLLQFIKAREAWYSPHCR